MRSPHQAPNASSPKRIVLEGGIKLTVPQASGRASPTKKTAAKIYQQPYKSATG